MAELFPDLVLLAATAITANGDTTTSDFQNFSARGIEFDLTISAYTSGFVSSIVLQKKIGSSYVDVYTWQDLEASILAAGVFSFLAYPAALSAGGWTAQPASILLPRTWRLKVTAGGGAVFTAALAGYQKT